MCYFYSTFGFVLLAGLVITLEGKKAQSKNEVIATIVAVANKRGVDLKTPPFSESEGPIEIQVLLYVTSIDAVSEANMDFTVGMLLHLEWKDPRIFGKVAKEFFEGNPDWDSLDFDSEYIKSVWVPDIFFPNEKRGSFHNIMTENQMMRLHRSGSILYISRLSMTLSCPMDLINYPFDKQTCNIYLMSFGFSDQDLAFAWTNSTSNSGLQSINGKPIIVDKEVVLPQFEVKGVKAGYCTRRYHQKEGNHSCLQVNFKLARNIGFYFVQMYIPSTLIVMLSWISFWLTVNSVPGRISLGLLTVLTMTTQSSSVNASLPRVSYTKAIDVWMSTCLVFVFAALLEFAVVNVLSRKDSIQGFSLKHAFTIPRELENRGGGGGSGPENNDVNLPLDGFEGDKKKGRFTKRGIIYATYLDIAARIFFPVCFITFIIIYWLYYVNAS